MKCSMGCMGTPWFSAVTALKQRILCRKPVFVPLKRLKVCSRAVMPRVGCSRSYETSGSIRCDSGVPRQIVELDVDESTLGLAVEASKDPHALYVSKVERDQVRQAIQQLPEEFREIIVLREYEELSYQEIATLLDCPAGTLMSRLGRARSKLRSLLSDTWRTPDRRAKGATE